MDLQFTPKCSDGILLVSPVIRGTPDSFVGHDLLLQSRLFVFCLDNRLRIKAP